MAAFVTLRWWRDERRTAVPKALAPPWAAPTKGLGGTVKRDVGSYLKPLDFKRGCIEMNHGAGGRAALQGMGEPVWLPDGSAAITSTGGSPSGGLAEQVADGSRPMVTLLSVKNGDASTTSVAVRVALAPRAVSVHVPGVRCP